MTKKEECVDSCSCENCGCNSGGRFLGVSLSTLGVIFSIITCLIACGALLCAQKSYEVSQASYNLNVLSAGGEENLKKMNELYSSQAYIDYATQQTDGYISSFMAQYGDVDEEDSDLTEDEINEDIENTNSPEEIKALVEDMLASTPIRGDKDARFTIIEYTELLCPYCQRHSQEGTINAVIDKFPGEVNSISRHFIIHGDSALQLAAAMECVAELNPNAYHETFDKAFAAYPVELAGLINIATELGTNATSLQSCIDEGKYTQAVEDMMNQASTLFGVNGTPGNVIIDRETGNYRLISGAYPVDEFINVINELKGA